MKQQVEALQIGSLAANIISKPSKASVFGISSRGIYLKSPTKWMLYLSYERFRSPLTINLMATEADLCSVIEVGDAVQLCQPSINFPRSDCKIQLDKSLVWNVDSAGTRTAMNERNRIAAVNYLQHREPNHANERIASQRDGLPTSIITRVRQTLTQRDVQRLESALISLLGYGPGLTPSGDDFVLGLMLRFNRWGGDWLSAAELDHLNRSLVEAAMLRTSQLSANLIECAAMGLADERLIAALDWLAGGEADDLGAIEELLCWGNSSGALVLEGFLIDG